MLLHQLTPMMASNPFSATGDVMSARVVVTSEADGDVVGVVATTVAMAAAAVVVTATLACHLEALAELKSRTLAQDR